MTSWPSSGAAQSLPRPLQRMLRESSGSRDTHWVWCVEEAGPVWLDRNVGAGKSGRIRGSLETSQIPAFEIGVGDRRIKDWEVSFCWAETPSNTFTPGWGDGTVDKTLALPTRAYGQT